LEPSLAVLLVYFGLGVNDAIQQIPDESLETLSLVRESLIHLSIYQLVAISFGRAWHDK
jgi:hypothetical protein